MKHHLISSQSWKKLLLPALVAGSLLALPVSTRASLPNTGSGNLSVIFGSATYPTLATGSTGSLNITTSTPNTVLGWINFSDGTTGSQGGQLSAGDIINFIQPSSTAAVLNEVTSGLPTVINGGTLTSNGKIFLLNPAGITINNSTSINAASFYASTVPETVYYFENNGALQVFTSTPPNTSTTGALLVDGGVQLTTIGGTGTIGFAGNSVSVGGYTASPGISVASAVNGNLYLESQGGAINVSSGTVASPTIGLTVGSATAGGNLTIMSNGGAVDLAKGSTTTIFGTATISTVGATTNGAVNTSNLFSATTAGTLSTVNAGTGASGGVVTLSNADFASIGVIGKNVTISDPTTNSIAIGASTINGTLAVTSTAGSINNTGAVAATGAITLTANSNNKSINFSTTGNVVFGAVSATGTNGAATITGTGNLSFSSAITSPTVSITTTGGNYTDSGIVAATKATISASGNVTLAAETTLNPALIVTSGNTITQAGLLNLTSGTFTAPTITLTNASNTIGTAILVGGSGSSATPVQLTDAVASLIVSASNVTGATSISNTGAAGVGAIVLGSGSNDTLSFGSTLSLTAGTTSGAISTPAKNLNVTGNVTANTTASAIGLGFAGTTNTSLGQIFSTTSSSLTINESATTNLGTVITTGALAVTSTANIVNTGNLKVTSVGATLSAGSAATPASIQIGSSTQSAAITGTINLPIASSFTLYDAPASLLTVATGTSGAPVVGSESLFITDGSSLTVNGSGAFGTLSFTTSLTSVVTVTDPKSLLLTNAINTGTGAVTVTATTGSLTLGSGITLLSTGNVSLAATAGTVTDTAASPVAIAGNVAISGTSIAVNNNTANSMGAVSLTSSGAIAYTEGQTVNIGLISGTSTAAAAVNIQSVSGNIIQTPSIGAITIAAAYTGANFSAPTGSVQLTNAANAIAGTVPVGITANGANTTGNTSLVNNDPVLLGNVQITGQTFTVNTTAFTAGTITQATGTSIFEYAAGTFTTAGGAVTLNNSGNNFGGLAIDTTNVGVTAAGASVKVRETGTNNYTGVLTGTGGNFTALDDAGNITETGTTSKIQVGGTASLTATLGAVTLNSTGNTNAFTGAVFISAPGNSSITDTIGTAGNGIILADGTTVTGNLTVTETGNGGSIKDSGSLSTITVGGTFAALETGTGASSVVFSGINSTFGAVQLKAGSGTSSLLDNGPLVLVQGSIVGGPLTLTSATNITTSGPGGSTFGSTVNLVASGSIVISSPVYITGVLTVDAIAGPTNLSFLSTVANLNNQTVVNAGNASNYTKPSP